MSSKNNWPKAYHAADRALRTIFRWLPVSPATERAALWWGYRYQPELGLTRLRSGAKLYLSDCDHLQLLIHYLGVFEPGPLSIYTQKIPAGGIVLDVGANIGLYTIEAARRVGSNGRVISIEAARRHVDTIRQSARENGFPQVEVISTAVGEIEGIGTLTLPADGNSGMFTLASVPGSPLHTVQIQTIDSIVSGAKVSRLDLIKMDIEGSEYAALRGAMKTLSAFRPALIIELNERALEQSGSSTSAVKELLASLGYEGFRIVKGGLEKIRPNDKHVCDECLFEPLLVSADVPGSRPL